jgi:hypothetical protein
MELTKEKIDLIKIDLIKLDNLIMARKDCTTCAYATVFERPVIVCALHNITFSKKSLCEKYKFTDSRPEA